MKLDAKSKQKLLEYIQKKNDQESSKQNSEVDQFQDAIAWMSSDIQSKVLNLNLTNQGKEKVGSEEFFLSMYRQILGNSLNSVVADSSVIDETSKTALKNSQDLGELLSKMVMLTAADELAGEQVTKSVITSYITKSLDMGVMPDEYISAIVMS